LVVLDTGHLAAPEAPSTAAAVPALLSANDAWVHGVCQVQSGDAETSVDIDPAFPACGGDGGGPRWFIAPMDSNATL
jgi:hypothetical protein